MENTNVSAEFIIVGDQFPINEVSQQLSISPKDFYEKGDITKHEIIRQETCWCFGTDYEESMDINNQLEKVIDKIQPKQSVLLELKEKYALEFKFMVVVNIENLEKPAIYLNKDTIRFISSIDAEMEFDYYIFTE